MLPYLLHTTNALSLAPSPAYVCWTQREERKNFYPADDDLINLCVRCETSVCSFIIGEGGREWKQNEVEMRHRGWKELCVRFWLGSSQRWELLSPPCDLYTSAECGWGQWISHKSATSLFIIEIHRRHILFHSSTRHVGERPECMLKSFANKLRNNQKFKVVIGYSPRQRKGLIQRWAPLHFAVLVVPCRHHPPIFW